MHSMVFLDNMFLCAWLEHSTQNRHSSQFQQNGKINNYIQFFIFCFLMSDEFVKFIVGA